MPARGVPVGGQNMLIGRDGERVVRDGLIPGLEVVEQFPSAAGVSNVDFHCRWQGVDLGVEVKTQQSGVARPNVYKLTGWGFKSLEDESALKTAFCEERGLWPAMVGITLDYQNGTWEAYLKAWPVGYLRGKAKNTWKPTIWQFTPSTPGVIPLGTGEFDTQGFMPDLQERPSGYMQKVDPRTIYNEENPFGPEVFAKTAYWFPNDRAAVLFAGPNGKAVVAEDTNTSHDELLDSILDYSRGERIEEDVIPEFNGLFDEFGDPEDYNMTWEHFLYTPETSRDPAILVKVDRVPTDEEVEKFVRSGYPVGMVGQFGRNPRDPSKPWIVNKKMVKKMPKAARWQDVQLKAKRLKDSGAVQVTANTETYIAGKVQGDNGTYETHIWRENPSDSRISQWQCGCPWHDYAFGRTRQWKKYEARPCSHVMALYWTSLSRPLDNPDQGALFQPGSEGPSQSAPSLPVNYRRQQQKSPIPGQLPLFSTVRDALAYVNRTRRSTNRSSSTDHHLDPDRSGQDNPWHSQSSAGDERSGGHK